MKAGVNLNNQHNHKPKTNTQTQQTLTKQTQPRPKQTKPKITYVMATFQPTLTSVVRIDGTTVSLATFYHKDGTPSVIIEQLFDLDGKETQYKETRFHLSSSPQKQQSRLIEVHFDKHERPARKQDTSWNPQGKQTDQSKTIYYSNGIPFKHIERSEKNGKKTEMTTVWTDQGNETYFEEKIYRGVSRSKLLSRKTTYGLDESGAINRKTIHEKRSPGVHAESEERFQFFKFEPEAKSWTRSGRIINWRPIHSKTSRSSPPGSGRRIKHAAIMICLVVSVALCVTGCVNGSKILILEGMAGLMMVLGLGFWAWRQDQQYHQKLIQLIEIEQGTGDRSRPRKPTKFTRAGDKMRPGKKMLTKLGRIKDQMIGPRIFT